jgi:hypothetical protein
MLLVILVLVLVFGGGGGFTVIAAGDMARERALDWGLYLLMFADPPRSLPVGGLPLARASPCRAFFVRDL